MCVCVFVCVVCVCVDVCVCVCVCVWVGASATQQLIGGREILVARELSRSKEVKLKLTH